MTKLRNSYPEDIACVLCFPRVFQRTEEYILDQKSVCAASNSETSAFRVNLFQLLYCWSIGRVYSGNLSSETFRVTSVIGSILPEQRLVMEPTSVSVFLSEAI